MSNKGRNLLFVIVFLFSACQSQPVPAENISTPVSMIEDLQTEDPDRTAPRTSPTDSAPLTTHITIDGNRSDWSTYGEKISDRVGDQHEGGFDIKATKAIANDKYLYVLIETEGIPHRYEQIDLDVVTKGIHFVVSFNPETCFLGHIGQDDHGRWIDIGDVPDATLAGKDVIEYKIPLAYFGEIDALQYNVRPMGGKCCQYPDWYPIDESGLAQVMRVDEVEPKPSLAEGGGCVSTITIAQNMDLTKVRGDEIHDLVISPDGQRAYTMGRGTDVIFTIDLTSNQIISWLDIAPDTTTPYGPAPEALALSPDGRLLLSANQTDDSVTIIDTQTNAVLKKLPAPDFPMNVAVSPDSKVAYVVGNGGDYVTAIDLSTLTMLKKIPLPRRQTHPYAVAFTSDGKSAYVGTESEALYQIDTSTHKVVDSIRKPASGWSNGELVITPGDRYAYLSSLNGNWIIKFDLDKKKIDKTLEIQMPEGLALSPDGTLLMAGRMRGGGVSKYRVVAISTDSDQITGGVDYATPDNHVSWENDVQGIAFTPNGSLIYIPVVDADGIFIADAKTLKVSGFIPLTAFARYQPTRALVSPDGKKLFVMNYHPQPTSVSIIDLQNNAVHRFQSDRSDACMKAARGIALTPKGDVLYVATSDHCILAVDTGTYEVIEEFQGGGRGSLSDFAIHPQGEVGYAVDLNGMFYEIDLVKRVPLKSLQTVPGAHYLKIAADGKRAYVSGSRGYAVVDLAESKVLHSEDFSVVTGAYDQATLGTFSEYFMRQIGVKPDLSQYIVGEFQSMRVYDAESFEEQKNINLFEFTRSMALSTDVIFAPDSKKGYFAMWDEKVVVEFDAVRWKPARVIDVGRAPYFGVCPRYFALSPDGSTLYVVNEQSDNVAAIDTRSMQIVYMYDLLESE